MEIEFVRKRLATRLSARPDPAEGAPHASVAIVFREGPRAAEVLLIERAEREGDPWSGHMAFPGGRTEPADDSSRATALRETYEEVGVDLTPAEYLGQLDGVAGNPGNRPRLVVAAHAFLLEANQPFALDRNEVRSAFWVPLVEMLDASRRVEYTHPYRPEARFPGILVGEPGRHVVWGLTYRFFGNVLEHLGHEIPPPPAPRS